MDIPIIIGTILKMPARTETARSGGQVQFLRGDRCKLYRFSKKMFNVYVLKSANHNYLYKGYCEDLDKRLAEHNSGKTRSNKNYLPFIVVYVEEFKTKSEAIKRERYFKTSAGRRFLKKKLSENRIG